MNQHTDFATYAVHAELALSAYADLGKDAPRIENLRRVGMTDSQAEDFLTTWKVIVQFNDASTNASATIFEHICDRKRCLAISRAQQQKPIEPGMAATPEKENPLNLEAFYTNIKTQVTEWIGNSTLPEGATVAGHYIGGHLAVTLKKEYPTHISAAYFFMADTYGKISGLADDGVFATETHKVILDLNACECSRNNFVIDTPHATTPGKPEGGQTSTTHNLEDNNMKRLASLLLALELLTGCTSYAKMKMDAEVDRLCAIDGGLKIYETVSLPPEKFDKYNNVNFFYPSRGENALGPEYIWKSHQKFLHPGGDPNASPRMWRDHAQIFRRSDGKLLGESISYARYGGDSQFLNELMGGPPESHHRCPIGLDVVGGVFKNENRGTK